MEKSSLHSLFLYSWGYILSAGIVTDPSESPAESAYKGDAFNAELLKPYGRLLDIGSGYGRTANWLSNYVPEVHAVEQSADKVLKLQYNSNVTCYVTLFETVTLDGKFDSVWLSESYCYFRNYMSVFEKILELLEPNGRVLVSDFFFSSPPSDPDVDSISRIRGSCNEVFLDEFIHIIGATGFKVVGVTPWEKKSIQFYKAVRDKMGNSGFSEELIKAGQYNMDCRIALLKKNYDKYSIILEKR